MAGRRRSLPGIPPKQRPRVLPLERPAWPFPATRSRPFRSHHLHFYTWDGWVELFTSAGFHIDTVVSSGVPAGLALPRWNGSPAVRALERLSFESARMWKTLFAYQFIVRAHP